MSFPQRMMYRIFFHSFWGDISRFLTHDFPRWKGITNSWKVENPNDTPALVKLPRYHSFIGSQDSHIWQTCCGELDVGKDSLHHVDVYIYICKLYFHFFISWCFVSLKFAVVVIWHFVHEGVLNLHSKDHPILRTPKTRITVHSKGETHPAYPRNLLWHWRVYDPNSNLNRAEKTLCTLLNMFLIVLGQIGVLFEGTNGERVLFDVIGQYFICFFSRK